MLNRIIPLLLCWGIVLLTGCDHVTPKVDTNGVAHQLATANPCFSTDNRMPGISFSGYYPNTNGTESDYRPYLRIIPDNPGQHYDQPRSILLKLDFDSPSFIYTTIILDEMYPKWYAAIDQPPFDRPIYFLSRIDDNGKRTGWSGPWHADDPDIRELLQKKIDFSDSFEQSRLASNISAFIKDMAFCHGYYHGMIDTAPYVIDWRSMDRALSKLKNPEQKHTFPDGSIWMRDKGLYTWVPILVPSGDSLSPLYGALSTELNFETGRVEMLWIDMN